MVVVGGLVGDWQEESEDSVHKNLRGEVSRADLLVGSEEEEDVAGHTVGVLHWMSWVLYFTTGQMSD